MTAKAQSPSPTDYYSTVSSPMSPLAPKRSFYVGTFSASAPEITLYEASDGDLDYLGRPSSVLDPNVDARFSARSQAVATPGHSSGKGGGETQPSTPSSSRGGSKRRHVPKVSTTASMSALPMGQNSLGVVTTTKLTTGEPKTPGSGRYFSTGKYHNQPIPNTPTMSRMASLPPVSNQQNTLFNKLGISLEMRGIVDIEVPTDLILNLTEQDMKKISDVKEKEREKRYLALGQHFKVTTPNHSTTDFTEEKILDKLATSFNFGINKVIIYGSWDAWTSGIEARKTSENEYKATIPLLPGEYYFSFEADNVPVLSSSYKCLTLPHADEQVQVIRVGQHWRIKAAAKSFAILNSIAIAIITISIALVVSCVALHRTQVGMALPGPVLLLIFHAVFLVPPRPRATRIRPIILRSYSAIGLLSFCLSIGLFAIFSMSRQESKFFETLISSSADTESIMIAVTLFTSLIPPILANITCLFIVGWPYYEPVDSGKGISTLQHVKKIAWRWLLHTPPMGCIMAILFAESRTHPATELMERQHSKWVEEFELP